MRQLNIFDYFTLFAREAGRLARACREMSDRFLRGGRLLAFGRGPYATDAQHVSVEFVHPVIVGKRALPALDLARSRGALTLALPGQEGDYAMAACTNRAFLHPFLGQEKQATDDVLTQVSESIRLKVQEDARLREQVAHEQAEAVSAAAEALRSCVR